VPSRQLRDMLRYGSPSSSEDGSPARGSSDWSVGAAAAPEVLVLDCSEVLGLASSQVVALCFNDVCSV
jgi:hypothetical protein